MRKLLFVLMLFPLAALAAQRPWQKITVPTLDEVAANFRTPPRAYGAIHWCIWGGKLTRERIVHEFDTLTKEGIFVVNFGPARGVDPQYLSPAYLSLIKFAVGQAAKRGMKVWLADEGSYPSGFAGGEISSKYPQLCMQGIVADVHISVAPGQTLSMPVPPDTLGALTVNTSAAAGDPLPIANGRIQWTAPPSGRWQIVLIRHVFRSSPTRYINRADGTYSKDSLYSLIDYLNPNATRAFLATTHEVYKRLFGDQFGKTVLGFFSDEPDYTGFMPYTPTLFEQFQAKKGYDLKPYLPLLFAPTLTPEAWRVKADYYDVWSGIFSHSFFGVLADWCARNNLEELAHLNHEELMLVVPLTLAQRQHEVELARQDGEDLMMNPVDTEDLTQNEGSFFRDERYVQVPGVDNLGQTVPERLHGDPSWMINNNFPKLASSAAHLFGRPKAWAEEGGGLGQDGKFLLDYELVRGLNAMQLQGGLGRPSFGGNAAPSTSPPPGFSMLAWYTDRAGYLMAIGRPAAQVALYIPESSFWLGDEDAEISYNKLGEQLLDHQIDFDYIDEQSVSSLDPIVDGGFKNLSGQIYRAVIIPSSVVISRASLKRLREFAAAGGKVIFVGHTPTMIVDRTFLHASGVPDLSFALLEPSDNITPRVIADLPKPDVKLSSYCEPIRYTHRSWQNADLYFFFNQSDQEQSRTAIVAGRGHAQVWDLRTGLIHPIKNAVAQPGGVELPLVLAPYEAKVIVVGPLPPHLSSPAPELSTRETLEDLAGDWSLTVDGKSVTTPLESWQKLGEDNAVAGTYRKTFTLASVPAGKRILLECGNVRDYARVRLNGVDLRARAWQPYRWDVSQAIHAGENVLEIEVRPAPFRRRPAPVPANPSARNRPRPTGAGAPRFRPRTPPVSGLLGPVRLVACD